GAGPAPPAQGPLPERAGLRRARGGVLRRVVWPGVLPEPLVGRGGSQWQSGAVAPAPAPAAGGAVVLGVTATFAAIDWLMSLEPHWYSTVYGAIVAWGSVLTSMAFAIVLLVLLSRRPPLASLVSPRLLNDLGSLLLAFLVLWSYMAYFQYLLIWAGN